ncbi:MAG: metallopeptidase family protein [Coriobacteriales bacterium]|jgi:predicted Zn-dependent protease with MMP-like domain
MYKMTDDEFEQAVQEALDSIPQRFIDSLDNVGIALQDEPDVEQLGDADLGTQDRDSGELLGLYEGIALTERGQDYGELGDMPDIITIFKGPHERCFDTREEVVEEIRKTVVHEIGHYYGLDEDQLAGMGYD